MNRRSGYLAALGIFLLITAMTSSVWAEEVDDDTIADAVDAEESVPEAQSNFGPGSIDVNAGIGASNSLIYLNAEPGLNVGLIGPSDRVVFSAGASLNLGYCLLCHVLDLADVRVRASNISPMLRGTIHLPALMEALGAPEIDARVGLIGGIGNYSLDIGHGGSDPEIAASVRTNILGPFIGGTYSLDGDRGPFAFAELRLLFELGTASVTISAGDDDEERVIEVHGDVARQGVESLVGVGFRF